MTNMSVAREGGGQAKSTLRLIPLQYNSKLNFEIKRLSQEPLTIFFGKFWKKCKIEKLFMTDSTKYERKINTSGLQKFL